jgi:carbon monoxide dehydrogenase subunit G
MAATGTAIAESSESPLLRLGPDPLSEIRIGDKQMASLRKEITVNAKVEEVWDAMHDIGALHTRLVPGFVVDTQLEPGARIVTFANGLVVREQIVTIDHDARRLVWSATGGMLTHHNGSAQVFEDPDSRTRIVWMADLLPDSAAEALDQMMSHGMTAMQVALDHPSSH